MAKKKETDRSSGGRPVNFRAPDDLAADLDYVSAALGVDVSNLVRMILRENMAQYRQRADRINEESARKGGE